MNYIKSSCIIFCTKMFGYSHHIYFLQEELTHFSREVLKHLSESTENFWVQKSYKKNDKIHKFSCIIFCNKMFQYLQLIYSQNILKTFFPIPTRFYYLLIFNIKNWFYSFFLIFWQAPIPKFCRRSHFYNKPRFF